MLSGLCWGFWAAVTIRVHLLGACLIIAAGEDIATGEHICAWHWSKVNDLTVFCLLPGACVEMQQRAGLTSTAVLDG